ncbi:MAG: XrtA system polysaccharide deacetylase [Vicinamibacterales bacterium]
MIGAPAPGDARQVVNAFAVDLEDYFQVSAFDRIVPLDRWPSMEGRLQASTERLLRLFADRDVRATFFVLGWNAERMPNLIRQIAAAGHEMASHSFAHRLVYTMSPAEFRADLRRAQDAIQNATGIAARGFRAPSYSITNSSLWAFDVLVEEGYQYDSSVFPIRHDRYGVPGAERHPHVISRPAGTIWEVPPPTVRLCGVTIPAAAGGYLRLMPFWWTQWCLRRINGQEHCGAIVSTHPWELDPGQPRLRVGPLTRLRHYGNIGLVEGRIRRLLDEHRFTTITDVLAAHVPHGLTSAAALAF